MTSQSIPNLPWIIIGADIVVGLAVLAGLQSVRVRLGNSRPAERQAVQMIAVILIGWFVAALWLSKAGVFRATSDGPLLPIISYGIWLPVVLGVPYIAYSKTFRGILAAVPQHWLVGVQVYRNLGIVFLILHAAGLLPGAFALPAGYGDIFVGLTAPMAAYLVIRGLPVAPRLVLLWNVVGILDLVIAVTLGFLSAPGPFQLLSLDLPNEMIGAYPLVMVPVFAVPLSILLHACSLRKLGMDARHEVRTGLHAR